MSRFRLRLQFHICEVNCEIFPIGAIMYYYASLFKKRHPSPIL
jgi:hypothetical protein